MRRGNIDWEERSISGKLFPHFVFSYIEDTRDMFYHLLMRPGCLRLSRTIRRGRGNDIRSAASMIIDRR